MEGKGAWATAKRKEGRWREVCAYDADDLEGWLELSPAVHAWISGLLGKDPDVAQDLETYWTNWAEETTPALTPGVIIAGHEREEAAQDLRARLSGHAGAVAVQADSREEALAFLAAALHRLPDAERDGLLARALVVSDPKAWRRITTSEQPLLLVPLFAGADAALAVRSGHTVIIPLGYEEVARGVARWANASDPPVRRIGTTWLLASKEDAWSLLAQFLIDQDLQRFEDIAVTVLGASNPALELPVDRRWMAPVLGHARPHSGLLRKEIADTLALMAARRTQTLLSGGRTGQDRADHVVRQLLARANADETGALWASLSDILPLL